MTITGINLVAQVSLLTTCQQSDGELLSLVFLNRRDSHPPDAPRILFLVCRSVVVLCPVISFIARRETSAVTRVLIRILHISLKVRHVVPTGELAFLWRNLIDIGGDNLYDYIGAGKLRCQLTGNVSCCAWQYLVWCLDQVAYLKDLVSVATVIILCLPDECLILALRNLIA